MKEIDTNPPDVYDSGGVPKYRSTEVPKKQAMPVSKVELSMKDINGTPTHPTPPALGGVPKKRQALPVAELQQLIKRKWPEATTDRLGFVFQTGIPSLDRLFPHRGIPCGQLIEITGGASSGKTALLFKILTALTQNGRVAYIDLSHSFFPVAAAACGVNLRQLMVINPDNSIAGLRAAELLLQHHITPGIVFDLVGSRQAIPMILLHRLRLKTVRAGGLIIFLTERKAATPPTAVIPPSTVSLRLEVRRENNSAITVTVIKSRISKEGATAEVILDE